MRGFIACKLRLARSRLCGLHSQHGNSAAHVAAAFGALDVIRLLHAKGADFSLKNEVSHHPCYTSCTRSLTPRRPRWQKKWTPRDAAEHIGEPDAVRLIDALLEGAGSAHADGVLAVRQAVSPPEWLALSVALARLEPSCVI